DPGAAGDETVGLAAFGAAIGRRGFVAAMVAGEAPAQAVFDQPGAAVRALEAEPARAAQRERGVAAAVEEQQRLLFLGEPLVQRLDHARREPSAALRAFLGQVDGADLGELGAAE